MRKRFIFAVAVGLATVGFVSADDNVRDVQTKLRDGGFYSGEIDGAYSSDLSAALTRYQIRNGLPITGQLDEDTSKALGTKAAVTTTAQDPEQSSETWRQLRRGEQKTAKTETREKSSPPTDQSKPEVASRRNIPASPPPATTESETQSAGPASPQSATAAQASVATRNARETSSRDADQSKPEPATRQSSPAATGADTIQSETQSVGPASPESTTAAQASVVTRNISSPQSISTDRLRDYVGAFVLAGLDRRVGAEADFFADRVQYYDQGVISRDQIREDLKQYAARWPERRFRFAGEIIVKPQNGNRLQMTFPLRYDLRNGTEHSSGKIDKTLVVELVGEDLQIVAVNETKAD